MIDNMIFGLLDDLCAEELGVPVDEYIDKIERTTPKRREVIILTLVEGIPEKVIKAKRIFKLL